MKLQCNGFSNVNKIKMTTARIEENTASELVVVISGKMNSGDEFISPSQGSLAEEALQKIEESSIPVSTSKATNSGVKKFQSWCSKRDVEIAYQSITAEKFSTIIRKFYTEVRQVSGKKLSPSSMVGILAALNRYIQGAPLYRKFNLVSVYLV